MPDRLPDRIGKFEILRILGHGAMGEVYLAQDTVIGRQVALKVIRPALAGLDPGGELQARFQREARAAGILSHPHIVTVYEFGEEGGLLFLAMEYVEGEDFGLLLAEKALTPPEILEIVAQICEGLQQAHKHGILHRDMKPSNVMVTREDGALRARLMDFGVAKATGATATQTGQVVGTLAYMAPEYLRTGEAGPLTDLFSVGVMLHEALAGERPFGGATTGAVVYGIINDPPRSLEASRLDGLSPAIASVIAGLLEKDPARRRPGSAAELAKWLRAAKDRAWRLPDDGDATTALSKQAVSTLVQEAGTSTASMAIPKQGWKRTLVIAIPAVILGGLAMTYWMGHLKAPMPMMMPPTASDLHLNDVYLDTAAEIADKGHPDKALKLAQAVIDATPRNMSVDPDAYGVKLLCLYKLGDLVGFGETLAEARTRGDDAKALLTNEAYKAMLEKDKAKKKLPEKLRDQLLRGEDPGSGETPATAS